MKLALLDAETLGEDADIEPLRQFGELELWDRTSKEEVTERGRDADVLIINKVRISAEELDGLEKLKLICITATGTDNVALDAAAERGIAVTNVAGYSTESVAQHTFALLFALLHQLAYYDRYVKSGAYTESGLFTHIGPPFWELAGKAWGIIGLGRIGRRVARLASAFGAEVLHFSTSGQNSDQPYPTVELHELLERARIVSIHAPLNDVTRNLIERSALARMSSDAILINAGRGGIVDEAALADALNRGEIAGAALDVMEHEPPRPDNPLLSLERPERILLTPHNAWTSKESRARLLEGVRENIAAFVAGKITNRVR